MGAESFPKNTIILIAMLCLVFQTATAIAEQEQPLYKNPQVPVEQRIDDLIQKMTLDEKLHMLGGDKATHLDTLPNERLGIPAFHMADGPHGVRLGQATSFPPAISMASTWDVSLIQQLGVALATETLAKGRNMILGPCVNLHRVSHGGRNFESFSEDPYLTSRMAVAYINGVQSTGTIASVKHFACNNQEWNRKTIDVKVSERALREVYLPAFKAAVQEANVWNVMASYNKVNGEYTCENKYLLTDILKNEWGFKGFVVSDWGSTHSTIKSANAGLDLEMPYLKFFGEPLLDEVLEGNVPMGVINDKVRRLLRVMFVSGLFDGTNHADPNAVNSAEHKQIALQVARDSMVLLKNKNNMLPLNKENLESIAVIGPKADAGSLGGSGSSEVTPFYAVSALEGIRNKVDRFVKVAFERGCIMESFEDIPTIDPNVIFTPDGQPGLRGEYFANTELMGEPVFTRTDNKMDFWWGYNEPAPGVPIRNFSVRWTGKLKPTQAGRYTLAAISEPGSRLYIDGELVIDNWADHQVVTKTKTVTLEAGKEYDIRFEYFEAEYYAIVRLGMLQWEDMISKAANLAFKSNVAIVFVGADKPFEGEGHDRPSLELSGLQNELIEAVIKANNKTIVVLNNGTPIIMNRWIDDVPAIIEAWYPGQEGGNAIADVLFGDVNPSGKLPVTFPKKWSDHPAYDSFRKDPAVVVFTEDLYIGYRYFDKMKTEPLFPFGHGLSYTTFYYGNMTIIPPTIGFNGKVTVSVDVTNTGEVAGAEVVQMYVSDVKSTLDRPVQELKGFKKVFLQPGKTATVTFELDQQALSFYDPEKKSWVAEAGKFEVRIGSSSRDIRISRSFKLEGNGLFGSTFSN